MAPTYVFQPLGSGDNAAAITALFSSGGPGTTVLLLSSTIYVLHTAIRLCHPNTTLATQGYPAFESGLQAIIETRGEKEAIAVDMYNLNNVTLKRVHVRGCRGWGRTKPESEEEEERLRKEGKLGWLPGGGAMIWMGGPESQDAIVEGCRLEDPRGWTAVHVCDFGLRPKVLNNVVGPCGQEASGGPWADGLSVAGKESIIIGNTVTDATDGAIVIFCAPGSTIANNTVVASKRDLLGGINMVDDFPYDRDFSNTRVFGNTIRTEGDAYIRLGIGIGPTCWAPYNEGHKKNEGGSVLHNYLGPGRMGYGIALSSARDFTVLGNVVQAGTSFIGDTCRLPPPLNAAPTAFLLEWRSAGRTEQCNVQDDFLEGDASWLIGIENGVGEKLEYGAGQIRLDVEGKSASGEGGIRLKGARWEVSRNGSLDLREESSKDVGRIGKGRLIWTSGSSGKSGKAPTDPTLEFRRDGSFAVRNGDDLLWDPLEGLPPTATLDAEDLSPTKTAPPEHLAHPSATFANHEPYLSIRSRLGNTLFATAYEYVAGKWQLDGGRWVAIIPPHRRGHLATTEEFSSPPPIPTASRPSSRHPHLSGFVHQIADGVLNTHLSSSSPPPPLPPRPGSQEASEQQCQQRPTFLFLSSSTHQLILHSSSSPTSPSPEATHWTSNGPLSSSDIDASWCAYQGDGNLVLYVRNKSDGAVWVPWASGLRGERLKLRCEGEKGGPALELWDASGTRTWSSRG